MLAEYCYTFLLG